MEWHDNETGQGGRFTTTELILWASLLIPALICVMSLFWWAALASIDLVLGTNILPLFGGGE